MNNALLIRVALVFAALRAFVVTNNSKIVLLVVLILGLVPVGTNVVSEYGVEITYHIHRTSTSAVRC